VTAGIIAEGGSVMRTQPHTKIIHGIFTASVLLIICGEVSAQTIIPLHQQRSVNTFLIVPQCADEDFDENMAKGFEPFNSHVSTEIDCDSGFASGFASQDSQIGHSSLTASGIGSSQAGGPGHGVVHAFGYSIFQATFELPSLSMFTLEGMMSAEAMPDANDGVGVLARLWEGEVGGNLIFEQSIEAPADGGINKHPLEAAGILEHGVYVLDVQAGSFIDNDVPPDRSGQASFEFTFDVTILGDLDESGTVNTVDLLLLFESWGPCTHCEACPADLNGNCAVGTHDLLLLLGNWG